MPTTPSEPLAGEMSDLLFWRNFRKLICLTTFPGTDFSSLLKVFYSDTNFLKPIFRLRNFWKNFPTHWNFLPQFSYLKCFIPIFQLQIILSQVPILRLDNFWYWFYDLNFVRHQIFSHQFSNSEVFTCTIFSFLKFLATVFQLRTSSSRPNFSHQFSDSKYY